MGMRSNGKDQKSFKKGPAMGTKAVLKAVLSKIPKQVPQAVPRKVPSEYQCEYHKKIWKQLTGKASLRWRFAHLPQGADNFCLIREFLRESDFRDL